MDNEVFDQGTFRASGSPRPRAYVNLLEGFLLSRQVEGATGETLKTYKSRLSTFLRFLGQNECGDIRLVQQAHIYRYLLKYQELKRSPAYVNAHYRAVRAFFNWCVQEEYVERSPLRNIKAPKVPKIAKGFISEKQRDLMLLECPLSYFTGARNAAIIWLFWSTGMRLSELATLKRDSLNWENSTIRVFGKGQKERFVPFTPEAKKALWRYLSFRGDDLPQLWITEEGAPGGKWMVTSAMRRILEWSGLRNQLKDACHVFRRSWAMRNLKAGVAIKFIQLVGGWSSVNTLEIYVRAMTSEDAMKIKWV